MTAETTVPRFVNLQTVTVNVPREGGGVVMVQPFRRLQARPTDPEARKACVIEGEHYRQFVSDKGPLYPFPPDADQEIARAEGVVAAITGTDVSPLSTHDEAIAAKNRVAPPTGVAAQSGPRSAEVAADVLSPGGQVKTESLERSFDESLRVIAGDIGRFHQLQEAGIHTVAELASERNLPRLAGIEGSARMHADARGMLGLSVPDDDEPEPEETTPVADKSPARTKKKPTKKKSPPRKGRRG